jgi:hypothetical protein
MGYYKTVKKIHRQTLTDGKRTFTVVVPVNVEYWQINGQMEEVMPCEEMAKIERAIETQYPGWYHRCGFDKKNKKECPACQRKALDKVKLSGKLKP